MELIGDPKPRPAAPWGYTNTWGNNYCLLVVWFVAAVLGRAQGPRGRVSAPSAWCWPLIPVVYSLNRGLWIGLGVDGLSTSPSGWRMRGRLGALTAVVAAGAGPRRRARGDPAG